MSHSDEQAERAIIGAVLCRTASRVHVGELKPEDFSVEAHRYVWHAVLYLFAQGKAVDVLTLHDRLKTQGRLVEVLEALGGAGGLQGLDESGRWQSAEALAAHVAIVRDRAMRRRLHAELLRRAAMTVDLNLTPERIAAGAVQALLASETRATEEPPDIDVTELVEQWCAFIEREESGRPMGLDNGAQLRTGIEILDSLFYGFVGNLNVVGGRASMGKTALVAEMIWNWLKAGIPGGIMGLEDGTKWLTRRHLSRALGLPVSAIGAARLHEHQLQHMQEWLGHTAEMYRKHLRIHRAGGIDAPGLLAKVQRWIADGARWVVVDHGLRVDYSAEGDGRRYDMAIGRTLDALATLGDRHKVAIIVNWHLNRQGEDEVRPKMRDYKESGYLDAAARTMLGLWEQSSRPGYLLVTGVKATEGKRDWTVAVERDAEHALVHSAGGYEVDFERESREAKDAADRAKAEAKQQRNNVVPRVRP